eukprot:COSAG05_NODE_156_length_15696_cov_359.955440_7_plen_435_part_00
MDNPTPWPEIKQHVQRVTHVLNGACDSMAQAQTVIARRWREKQSQGPVDPGRLMSGAPPALTTLADVTTFFTAPGSCTATCKLDGTNVGIDTEGSLFGRRKAIPEGNQAYQKAPLASLRGRGAQVTALRSAVASAARIPEIESLPFLLYGELCVNNLYDYQAAGAFKSWRVFGAVIQVQQDGGDADEDISDIAVDITRRLVAAGFRARVGNAIVLSMCDNLRATIQTTNKLNPTQEPLECVPETARGSMVEVVDQALTWMLEMKGEGLVLTYPGFASQFSMLGKWKCAQEPQPKNIEELKQLRQRLSEAGDFPPSLHFLFPEGVVEMIAKMQAIATVSVAAAATPQKPADGQTTVDNTEVDEAIASALTKFDSPAAYFERNERKQFTTLILEEVMADLKAVGGSKLAKLVIAKVQKTVGQEFGRWKKAQSTTTT